MIGPGPHHSTCSTRVPGEALSQAQRRELALQVSHTLSCAGFKPGLLVPRLGPATRVRTHTKKLSDKGINSASPSSAAFPALPIRGQKRAWSPTRMLCALSRLLLRPAPPLPSLTCEVIPPFQSQDKWSLQAASGQPHVSVSCPRYTSAH